MEQYKEEQHLFRWAAILLLVLLAIAMGSCVTEPSGPRTETGKGYTVVEIDGCQYIEVSFGTGTNLGYYSLTHKGNCKNPIHKP